MPPKDLLFRLKMLSVRRLGAIIGVNHAAPIFTVDGLDPDMELSES